MATASTVIDIFMVASCRSIAAVRQFLLVLVALGLIVGAATLVLSWGDDDEPADEAAGDEPVDDDAAPATTTNPPTTTVIPTRCGAGDAGTTTTTTLADPAAPPPSTEPVEVRSPTLADNSTVSTVGLDSVTFGLTVAQAEAAAGTPMVPCEPVSECYRVTPAVSPPGISFVVTDGTIERVDISEGPITTRSGFGVGTTEDALVEAFGESLERVELDASTTDLVFVPSSEADAEFRVVFTVVDGEVSTFRSGRLPLVLDSPACVS